MNSEVERLLLFTVREKRYAVDLRAVAEVLAPPPTFPVPWVTSPIKGAINFHGALVAVLDLAEFIDAGAVKPDGDLLVLDRGIANLALRVDRVENIVPAELILEEDGSSDPLVEKLLIMADGEAGMLAVEKLLERVEEAIKR